MPNTHCRVTATGNSSQDACTGSPDSGTRTTSTSSAGSRVNSSASTAATGSSARGNCSDAIRLRLPTTARDPATTLAEVKWKRKTPTTRKPTKFSTPRLVPSSTPKTSR